MNHKKNGNELKGLNEMVNQTIKKTLLNLASWKRINSRQIVDLILNVDLEVFEHKEKEIFTSINIYELTENDYQQFLKIWEKIFDKKNMIYLLIHIIIKK